MKFLLIAAMALFSISAHAWDCSNPANTHLNVPGNECYVPLQSVPNPGASASTGPQSQGQGQTQGQGQGQSQTVAATGGQSSARSSAGVADSGNATQNQSATGGIATGGTATGGSAQGGTGTGIGGTQGQHQSAQATNAGNTQVSQSSTFVQANAPNLGLPTQIIAGCGVAMSAGGSNVHGAAMLGMGWTTAECYAYIEAQAYWAIGDRYDACEVLHTTNAAKRSRDRGAKFADCQLPPAQVIERIVEVGPSEDQIQLRIQHAIAEYIAAQPPVRCPKPKPGKHRVYAPCKMVS